MGEVMWETFGSSALRGCFFFFTTVGRMTKPTVDRDSLFLMPYVRLYIAQICRRMFTNLLRYRGTSRCSCLVVSTKCWSTAQYVVVRCAALGSTFCSWIWHVVILVPADALLPVILVFFFLLVPILVPLRKKEYWYVVVDESQAES